METLRRISLQNYKAWFTKPRKTGEHRVCVSPLSSQRHKCQRGRPGCCANLNARIVIPLAGSARDWLNLHLSPQRKEGQNCCRCFLFLYFFFFSHHHHHHSSLFKALQLWLFLDHNYLSWQVPRRRRCPSKKGAIGMMGRQFFLKVNFIPFFPAKENENTSPASLILWQKWAYYKQNHVFRGRERFIR